MTELTDAEWEMFWDFANEVEVPGKIVETGSDATARYIYAERDGMEYCVTVEVRHNQQDMRDLEATMAEIDAASVDTHA